MNQGDRPRLLVLGKAFPEAALQALNEHFLVERFDSADPAMQALRREPIHAVLTEVGGFLPLERELVGSKAAMVLDTLGEGVCVVDTAGRCPWSNRRMRGYSTEVFEKVKQIGMQALMFFTRQATQGGLTETASRTKKFTLQSEDRYYEVMTSPILDERGAVTQAVAVVWDATSGRRLQQKIDAIDAAGRELARIESDVISKLAPGERLKILRDKIIRYSKDLMHFDHFGIRLLDKRTNKLEVVISEGLPPEALEIDLYAQPEGNGISGYVAATGRSYVCHDTEKDPRYVVGLAHSKSSLTVPLMLFDKVVGVYNVESQKVGSFGEDDRQFAEIFGRYVALALNILDLLVVERCTITGSIADNVVQEIAQPLNDIITEAETLKEEYIGDDTMRARLDRITKGVEAIRVVVRDVAAGPRTVLGLQDAKSAERDPLIAGRQILVADDEKNIRLTIRDVLIRLGAHCEVAKDGFEAVTHLEQRRFDLVLSDIKMPYRNGYDVFAAARRARSDVPVILMTGFGYDPSHSIVRASQEGLACVLFKPFRVEQLLDEVRKALGAPAPAPSKP